jgi:hypothetical protein
MGMTELMAANYQCRATVIRSTQRGSFSRRTDNAGSERKNEPGDVGLSRLLQLRSSR